MLLVIAVACQEGKMIFSVLLLLQGYIDTDWGMTQITNNERTYSKTILVLLMVSVLKARDHIQKVLVHKSNDVVEVLVMEKRKEDYKKALSLDLFGKNEE
jgi:hypothetical protein